MPSNSSVPGGLDNLLSGCEAQEAHSAPPNGCRLSDRPETKGGRGERFVVANMRLALRNCVKPPSVLIGILPQALPVSSGFGVACRCCKTRRKRFPRKAHALMIPQCASTGKETRNPTVIPAKASIQAVSLDARFRGNDVSGSARIWIRFLVELTLECKRRRTSMRSRRRQPLDRAPRFLFLP